MPRKATAKTATPRAKKTGAKATNAKKPTKKAAAEQSPQDGDELDEDEDSEELSEVVEPVMLDDEPTNEQIQAEQMRIDEAIAASKKRRKGNRPDAGKDLLASYMEQLSHIPLFTPEQELANARRLEKLELRTLILILGCPKGAEHCHNECVGLEEADRNALGKLVQSYRRAAARTRKRQLPKRASREKQIQQIAVILRRNDFDKVVLDHVMQRLRREVWGRRVLDSSPAFRISHSDLVAIETSTWAGLTRTQ